MLNNKRKCVIHEISTVIDLVICRHLKFTSSVVSTSSTSSVFAAVCLNTDHTYSGKNTADEPL